MAARSPVVLENLPTFLQRLQQAPEPRGISRADPDEGITLWHGQPRDFKTMCALETGLALVGDVRRFTMIGSA
jgi:hypothetical protein